MLKEIIPDLDRWLNDQNAPQKIAIARVVDLEGSGPRQPGAAMAVIATDSPQVAGSVSGGCVEGAVVTEALDILATSKRRVVTFGYSDDEAFAVGLTCGGTIHIYIEPFDWHDQYNLLRADLNTNKPVALATVIASTSNISTTGINTGAKLLVQETQTCGSLGSDALTRVVERDARAELAAGRSSIRRYGSDGEAQQQDVTVFIESFATPPQMIIFGAVDFTAALSRVAKVLGYRVTVCDAREVFTTARRFPMADEVVVTWPDRLLDEIGSTLGPRDSVCVLTHDAKFDVPAIAAALKTNVGYIGVMGSRRTHDDRTARLIEAAVTETDLTRLRSPIGLDIGAVTPEETAVSIVSQIIAERTGRQAQPLAITTGPIHR